MDNQVSYKIFSGTGSRYLAKKICENLNCQLGKMKIEHFSDGEFAVSYEESIRGFYVFLIQSTFKNTNNLIELLLMIDAAKRASAKSIIAVIPYFGWARQDRKDRPRVAIGAKLVADLLSVAGINRLITMDLHADQIQGFFNVPVDHLYASSILMDEIKTWDLSNLTVATPDVGGTKRANSYAKYLDAPMVICYKLRKKANEIEDMKIIGDVKGANVILIDDMIDTAGTITKAAELMIQEGASSVRAIVSHPVMSDPAIIRIDNSVLTSIIVTDTIPYNFQQSKKIKMISVANLFATSIIRVCSNDSISSLYLFS